MKNLRRMRTRDFLEKRKKMRMGEQGTLYRTWNKGHCFTVYRSVRLSSHSHCSLFGYCVSKIFSRVHFNKRLQITFTGSMISLQVCVPPMKNVHNSYHFHYYKSLGFWHRGNTKKNIACEFLCTNLDSPSSFVPNLEQIFYSFSKNRKPNLIPIYY